MSLNKPQENKENASNTASTTDASKTSEVNLSKAEKPYDPYEEILRGVKWPYHHKKEIIIKRRPSLETLPGADPDDTRQKIGSSFKGSSVNRGLTKIEERRWLSGMLGLDLQSSEWEKGTQEYWSNINAEVPANGKSDLGGLKLEVGLVYNNREDFIADDKAPRNLDGVVIDPKGEPFNLSEYILYRYCLVYVEVANDISLVNMSPKIRFYMFTKEKQIQDKKLILERKRKANQIFNQNIGDRNWVDHVLYALIPGDKDSKVFLKDLSTIGNDEKDVLLFDYLEKDLLKFINIAEDKNLEMRSFVEMCIAMGLLHRIPNTSTILHEGSTVGNNMDEVVSYMRNPRFSDTLRTLKAQVNIIP